MVAFINHLLPLVFCPWWLLTIASSFSGLPPQRKELTPVSKINKDLDPAKLAESPFPRHRTKNMGFRNDQILCSRNDPKEQI
jgi:hypothetical protein